MRLLVGRGKRPLPLIVLSHPGPYWYIYLAFVAVKEALWDDKPQKTNHHNNHQQEGHVEKLIDRSFKLGSEIIHYS